jgi:hypothetical protein
MKLMQKPQRSRLQGYFGSGLASCGRMIPAAVFSDPG